MATMCVVGPGAVVRPRLPDSVYRRRRRTVAVAALSLLGAVGIGAQAVLDGPGGAPAAAAGTAIDGVVRRTVVARPGDSLWLIAEANHGDVDLRRYLDELIDLNGGTVIVVGQLVRLP